MTEDESTNLPAYDDCGSVSPLRGDVGVEARAENPLVIVISDGRTTSDRRRTCAPSYRDISTSCDDAQRCRVDFSSSQPRWTRNDSKKVVHEVFRLGGGCKWTRFKNENQITTSKFVPLCHDLPGARWQLLRSSIQYNTACFAHVDRENEELLHGHGDGYGISVKMLG